MNFGSARKSNVGTITYPGYSGVLTYPGYSEVLRGTHVPRARPCVLTVPVVSASARERTLSTEAARGSAYPLAAAGGGGVCARALLALVFPRVRVSVSGGGDSAGFGANHVCEYLADHRERRVIVRVGGRVRCAARTRNLETRC